MIKINKNIAKQSGFSHLLLPIIITLAVSLIGTYFLVSSRAAVPQKSDPTAQRVNPYTASCPGNKVLYGVPSGRTKGPDARQRVFGPPHPNANVAQTTFMGSAPFYLNKKVIPCLKAVEWDLKYVYKTKYKLKTIDGASTVSAQNPTKLFHAYGGAVDINGDDNPYYESCTKTCPHNMPRIWVKAFKNHGWYWGGNYKNIKDYMHFEWHGQK